MERILDDLGKSYHMDKKAVLKKLESSKLTAFQEKVLMATFSIPKGEIRTYKQIAKQIGHPNAYRAVGSALKINPMAPIIPCHRVIKSDGELGNYSAPGGARRKKEMLFEEGAI